MPCCARPRIAASRSPACPSCSLIARLYRRSEGSSHHPSNGPIGRVGSSGLSTGPHLHFALERDGQYINPLTENIGVNHQVSPRMRSLFDQFKDNYLAMLSKLPDLGGHFHVGAAVSSVAQATGQAATHLAVEQGSHRRSHHRWHSWPTSMVH